MGASLKLTRINKVNNEMKLTLILFRLMNFLRDLTYICNRLKKYIFFYLNPICASIALAYSPFNISITNILTRRNKRRVLTSWKNIFAKYIIRPELDLHSQTITKKATRHKSIRLLWSDAASI